MRRLRNLHLRLKISRCARNDSHVIEFAINSENRYVVFSHIFSLESQILGESFGADAEASDSRERVAGELLGFSFLPEWQVES